MKIFNQLYMVGSGQIGISHKADCHVYLIDGKEEIALIDSGYGIDVERILSNIREEGFNPEQIEYIFLTHSHQDHAGGAAEIADLCQARIICSPEEGRIVKARYNEEADPEIAKIWGQYTNGYQPKNLKLETINEKETVQVGNLEVEAIMVPGHSVESTCYLVKIGGKRCLFSGDVVHIYGLAGLWNSPDCDLQQYRSSIGKLSNMKIDALLPGSHIFTINNGQEHIDKGIERFNKAQIPLYTGMFKW